MRLNRFFWLFLLNFLATAEFWNLFLSMADEAVCTLGAERWIAGEWPFRDWDSHLPPGPYAVSALWYAVFGWSSPSPRILAGLIWAFTSVGIQLASERLLGTETKLRYLPWLLWTTGGVLEFPILSYHWMATCAMTWVLYAILLWVQENRGGVLLGVASACAGWFLQSEGLAALLSVALVAARLRRRPPPGYAPALFGSALLLFLPALIYPREFAAQALGLSGHLAFNHFPYSWGHFGEFLKHYEGLSPRDGIVPFLAGASHCELQLVRYAGYPLLLATALLVFERRRQRVAIALTYVMLAWTLALSNRLTVLYLSFLAPGWTLLIALLIAELPRFRHTLAALLAGLELFGWTARLLYRREAFQYPVATRAGTYYFLDPNNAAMFTQLSAWLQEIPPGTPVLAAPYLAHVYTLYRLRNPIREDVLIPTLQSAAQIQRAQQALRGRQVPFVLWAGPDVNQIAEEYRIDRAVLQQAFEDERVTLTEGYELHRGVREFGLYKRP